MGQLHFHLWAFTAPCHCPLSLSLPILLLFLPERISGSHLEWTRDSYFWYSIANKTFVLLPIDWLLLLLLSCFSRIRLCVTPQTAIPLAALSLGFSRQESRSGLPFLSPPVDWTPWWIWKRGKNRKLALWIVLATILPQACLRFVTFLSLLPLWLPLVLPSPPFLSVIVCEIQR